MCFKTIIIRFKEVQYKPDVFLFACLVSILSCIISGYHMGILLNMTGNPSESENKNKKLQNNALKSMRILF
jgi:hypothetical protein